MNCFVLPLLACKRTVKIICSVTVKYMALRKISGLLGYKIPIHFLLLLWSVQKTGNVSNKMQETKNVIYECFQESFVRVFIAASYCATSTYDFSKFYRD